MKQVKSDKYEREYIAMVYGALGIGMIACAIEIALMG